MPFSEEAGIVAFVFEKGGEGDFFFAEMASFGSCDGVKAGSVGSAAGEKAGSGRRADGSCGVAVSEANSFAC